MVRTAATPNTGERTAAAAPGFRSGEKALKRTASPAALGATVRKTVIGVGAPS